MLITENRAENNKIVSVLFSVIIFGPFGSLSVIHNSLTCALSALSALSVQPGILVSAAGGGLEGPPGRKCPHIVIIEKEG